MPQSHVFISYVRESGRIVERLADDLAGRGVDVWLDRKRLLPGQRWREKIREAIRHGSLFIAIFTPEYFARDTSYMNDELAFAIDELRLRPTDRAWFVPVVVSGTVVPDRPIGGGETLRDLHWLDLSDGWDIAVDVITRMALGELQPSARSWQDVSREVASYSPTPLSECLERGAIPVPDYRLEEALFAVTRSCRASINTVSYDDTDVWCVSEPRSRRYQAEKNAALMRGLLMSRILVLQRTRLQHDEARLRELLLDHMFRGIGVAIVLHEHLPQDRRHSGHDFVLYDDGQIVSVGGRESPWILVTFQTQNAAPASDRMTERHVWLYEWLLDHRILATAQMLKTYSFFSDRAVVHGNSVIEVSPDDDLDEKLAHLRSVTAA